MKIECEHPDGCYVRAYTENGANDEQTIHIVVHNDHDDPKFLLPVMRFLDAEDAEALARQLLKCAAEVREHEFRVERDRFEAFDGPW